MANLDRSPAPFSWAEAPAPLPEWAGTSFARAPNLPKQAGTNVRAGRNDVWLSEEGRKALPDHANPFGQPSVLR